MDLTQSFISIAETAAKQQARKLPATSNLEGSTTGATSSKALIADSTGLFGVKLSRVCDNLAKLNS
ncbi:MAG: hypothetical protein AB1589_18845 [Cyanobacteriota bacterium]